MATDYNANLIAELYSITDAEKATHVCDEMVEIGDAIFPRQIYEAYKKFRTDPYSHYFVSNLTRFKTSDVTEILKEIAHTSLRSADIHMMLDYLTDIEYFDSNIVNKVKDLFIEEIISEDIYEYDIDRYFNYLQKSGQDLREVEELLKNCFENKNLAVSVRKVALKKILKIKPKEYIRFYYENYDSIKNTKTEIIFVEEISTWYGGLVPLLHKKILEFGSPRAKEILEKEQLRKEGEKKIKDEKEQKEIKTEYETADVISDIANLRTKINKITSLSEKFGFPFFAPSEEIYQQGKTAKNKESLVGYCIIIRSLLGNFDAKLLEIEFSEEKALELLPDIKELKGSINKFHLLLLEKGIVVDPGIFGLRNISRIVSKLAHPEEVNHKEFTEVLKQEGLLDIYKEDNWSMLHREILLRYKVVLEKLLEAIK